MKAGGIALRLVLLTLLLLGVGVLHTLSHAGAQGGVSATGAIQDTHQAHDVPVDEAGTSEEGSRLAVKAVEQQDPQHRAHAEGAAASDCFALIPSGSWLLPPPCTETWSGTASLGQFRADVLQDPGVGPALSQLSVLRI